ncbi:MAG: PorV/PorQ family protein [Chitinophagales bacterium]|nr:PorV/PorQ family protein [Chitinophagales bacterium]MDW8419078.1 PorV/PorQ family protein [Chitinophagales bacterium]
MKKILAIVILAGIFSAPLYAGNPDRRGEAGAYELNMNGWARSGGFWGMNSARVHGLEAERINVAGLTRVKKTEVYASYALWMLGSGVGISHAGVAQTFKEENTIALHIQALNLGVIERTTTQNPEGGIGSYRPTFLNIGVSYARKFSNSIHGGVTMRMINEGIGNLTAFGFSVDAGLQYVTGPKDNIHFGVSLRNVGTPMKFRGDALATNVSIFSSTSYQLTVENKANKFELPTQLNIGFAYDFWLGKKREVSANVFKQDFRLTGLANFTSNAFGYDHYGYGVEFGWREMLMLRLGHRIETGIFSKRNSLTVYNGLAAGLSFDAPLKKDTGTKLCIDYSFRSTRAFSGTHSVGLRFTL